MRVDRPGECFALLLPRVIPAVLMLLAGLLRPAAAADSNTLHVLLNDAPPYRMIDRSGDTPRYSGIYVDIAQAAAALSKLHLRFTEVPYARAFAMMKNGEGDMMLGPNRTPDREAYLRYLEPALPAEAKVFVTATPGPRIAGYDDLHGLRIGTLRGAHYADRFDRDDTLNRITVVDYETALRMLAGRRVDTVIMPEQRARWLLRGMPDLHLAGFRIAGDPSHIVLSRRSPQILLAARIEAGLRQLQASGEIARILALYG